MKNKLLNIISAHPKAVTLAMGLGITLAIGTVIGTFDHSHLANAILQSNQARIHQSVLQNSGVIS